MIQNDLQTKLIMMVLKHLSRNQPLNLLMYCTKKKGSQNTSLQYLRFLVCFFSTAKNNFFDAKCFSCSFLALQHFWQWHLSL